MKKLFNIIYSLLGIIGGVAISNLLYLVSSEGVMSGESGEYAYATEIMIIMLMGSFLYSYILKLIRSIISGIFVRSDTIQPIAKYTNLISYIISAIGSSYLIIKNNTTSDTALFVTIILGVAISIFTFVYNRNDDEFYIAVPKFKSKKISEVAIKENNKRVTFNFLGIIFGVAFTVFVNFAHKTAFTVNLVSDKEVNNVLRIVVVAIACIVILFILNQILLVYCKKKYNKQFKNYYVIKDYFVDSFTIVYTISAYFSFVYFLGINRYLAILYVLGIKLLIKQFLPESIDPDFVYTGSTGSSYWYEKYVKDSHSDCGDMKFGFFSNGTSYFSYDIAPGMSESIAPGAFTNTLSNDIRCLTDHDTRLVLGRTSAHTFEVSQDEHGLYGRALVNPNDQDALNTKARVDRGDVNQASIGFNIIKEDTENREDGSVHWTIREIELFECSVCTFPAYSETNIVSRTKDKEAIEQRKSQAWKQNLLKKLKGAN